MLHHHERIDGQGFPEKKRGETIPLYSRIIAVADMFDLESRCSSLGAVLLKEGTELTQRMLDRAFASSNLDWLLTTAHVNISSMRK